MDEKLCGEYEKLYAEYERLILERDIKEKEAGSYLTAYVKEFGALITAAFEKKISCIKKKKSIAFCQACANRGERVDITELNKYLETEMASYNEELKSMLEHYEDCRKSKTSSEADVLKAKSLYRKLAKKIHPDMHPELSLNEEIKELWVRVLKAYHKNDAAALEELEILVFKALKELDIEDTQPEIEDIEEKIEELEKEIEKIMTTDPYLYRLLLENKTLVEEKKAELQKEIDEYTRYEEELDEILMSFWGEGVTMSWPTK